MFKQLPTLESQPQGSEPMARSSLGQACCRLRPLALGMALGASMVGIGGVSYFLGRGSVLSDAHPAPSTAWQNLPVSEFPTELLQATATHGGSNMAIATGLVDEHAEGFFSLDFVTGDLKGFVFYPRRGMFGGAFYTNVKEVLGMSKNPEYLLVTGGAMSQATSGSFRPGGSLIYVVDTKTGFFAAYTIPWNKSLEASGAPQSNTFVLAGGGQIREPLSGARKPATPPDGGLNPVPGAPAPAATGAPAAAGRTPPAAATSPAMDEDAFGQTPANPNAPANPRRTR